ncbi:MAG: urease accessory protein UreE [Muribaculaceae bacterium]|nr:urease accessory protein UreE [Muribaculaceae bacterium]MDE6286223.1 urease accessory protein UreE [Muribaculaceae bacterium]
MEVITSIIGNAHDPEWAARLEGAHVHNIFLDQWTAQKSRFLAVDEHGHEYPVALSNRHQVADGDIIAYDPEQHFAAILRLKLSPVLVVDLARLEGLSTEEIIRISLELGHAIGNQHWPAVVKGTKVYVPMTVDRKVMLSVMDTHHIDDITYEFVEGSEVIPYMAPHEVRRLFGGAGHESHSHVH